MALSTIYPNGVNEIIVPATQSIAISNFGGGIASIYYLIVTANYPPAYQLQQTLNNSSVVLGAFADGMTIKIEAGPSVVKYDVGASPDTGIGDADTLNGLASDTAATADTIAARDSSGDITANAFESTVATGTAPLTVASTTLVSNLNADTVDGIEGSNIAKIDASNAFTGTNTFDETVNIANATTTDLGISITRNSLNVATLIGTFGGLYLNGTQIISFSTGGTEYGQFNAAGDFRVFNQLFLGATTAGDTLINLYDLNSATYRTLRWSNANNDWYVEDNSGVDQQLYHSGINPSLGAGNGVSGSFTTADAKTVTVTNGLITSIV